MEEIITTAAVGDYRFRRHLVGVVPVFLVGDGSVCIVCIANCWKECLKA